MELLAPAGNYESFLGAVHAGADAVYLGGARFGARAYADNFTEEEICRAISYAHIFGKKVYLTVNTLIKEAEFAELIPYLTPFYLAGLDGVIVQDIGAFLAIREAFPGLALHVSTQMTITGAYGAGFLKDLGAVRIVPARELSLEEIKVMKQETGLEMETFIHGAMCYCYSGQCLFSSILGGRSGNRGRCAQPCRLPYQVAGKDKDNKEQYPLSLKDMCTISFLPKLIEAGIDSFKIEGRMKKPEYAAGVTAIYRKYIDLYYEKGAAAFRVSKEDLEKLSSLYIRSRIQEGYYFKHNGADMVTLHSPAYNGSDDLLLADIRQRYIETPLKKKIRIEAELVVGKEARLTVKADDLIVTVNGDTVMKAEKQPVTEENIKKGLLKLGNTPFAAEAEDVKVIAGNDIFYPLKAINELRRKGMEALEAAFDPYGRCAEQVNQVNEEVCAETVWEKSQTEYPRTKCFRILVSTPGQLSAVLKEGHQWETIYLESEMLKMSSEIWQDILKRCKCKAPDAKLYIALPYIIRKKDEKDLFTLLPILKEADGCLVRNMESYRFLKEQGYIGGIRTDAGVYCFNKTALQFWQENTAGVCLPYELNKKEVSKLLSQGSAGSNFRQTEQVIYGHIPLMITANCVQKTTGKCRHEDFHDDVFYLQDRYRKRFPIAARCRYCYNIIYNSLPLSLHAKVAESRAEMAMRLNLTIESENETEKIIRFFAEAAEGKSGKPPYEEYTLGHEKRGVE